MLDIWQLKILPPLHAPSMSGSPDGSAARLRGNMPRLLDKGQYKGRGIVESQLSIYVATVQVCGTGPDQWWVAFSGQTVVAASQIFILGIPAQLAATWFPPNQMSTATSIGVFGNQASHEGAVLELETKVHAKFCNHGHY